METTEGAPDNAALPSKDRALSCARLALEKKAYGITILNIGPMSAIAEYFIICSGRSVRQTRAIAEHLQTRLKKDFRELPLGIEGEREGSWILIDYGDIVIHIFYEPTREIYCLEKLWSEAPRLNDPALQEEERKVSGPADDDDEEDWD